MRLRHPTYTNVILGRLLPDDFMSVEDLCKATGCTASQVQAALHHLKRHRAVDGVDGYWFRIPDGDTRQRIVSETAYHTKRRRRRPTRGDYKVLMNP